MSSWEHFSHEADIGIRAYGPTLAAVFEQAALAMTAAITDIERIAPSIRVPISCHAPKADLLLVEWLNALVYEMAVRRMLFSRFVVKVENSQLTGEARGERLNIPRHRPAVEVKGATYTALEVSRRADGEWMAQCVIDV